MSTDGQVLRWWEALPSDTRAQVDEELRRGRHVPALKLLRDALGVSIPQGMDVIGARVELVRPPVEDGPVDPRALVRKAEALGERVLAVEAVWDGDTVHDRFVLLAVGETRDHPLEAVYASTATRHLGPDERVGGRPHVAVAAEAIGVAVARALRVPFHFAGPDEPDDRAPRWVRPGAAGC
ncbi:hypothetical protein [Kitasatospora cheerisanensis]|uniref:Uncharacterized protein n=1 Tax=Kitasatospora cheerisanensis KCTC 2395 TaxID=1348663 RepID=A0A066YNI6_9ACTN|nr:hypothetical protein [Kitasatospora cheerisanensis]KDN82722.1 hypothetical protein KCH_56370 [Kitasatospora cheerisanensis KCTC 2395]